MPDVSELLEKGGPVLYVILFTSVAGLTCIFYCLLILRRSILLPADLVRQSDGAAGDAAGDLVENCRKEGGPFAEILLTVVDTRDASREEAEGLVEAAGRRAVHLLGKGPLFLEVIAAISPLLGLLGTVLGMHKAFVELGESGVKDIGTLSVGISEALITTIAGLVVAIPAYVAYTWFSRKVDAIVLEMERHAMHLMGKVRSQ